MPIKSSQTLVQEALKEIKTINTDEAYELSQNDIDMVLSLEKRHFGALSGQGLVQTALQNYQKAIDSYIEAHKIYPSSQSTLQMIEQLNILIQKESI